MGVQYLYIPFFAHFSGGREQGLKVEPNNSLCVDGVRKTTVKISEVCPCDYQ